MWWIRKEICCYVDLPDQVWQPNEKSPMQSLAFGGGLWMDIQMLWNFWIAWGKSVYSIELEFCTFTNVGIFVFICCCKMSQGLSFPVNGREISCHTGFPCISSVLRWHLLFLVKDRFCLPYSPFHKIWLVLYPTLNKSLSFILWAIVRFHILLSSGGAGNYYVAVRGTL